MPHTRSAGGEWTPYRAGRILAQSRAKVEAHLGYKILDEGSQCGSYGCFFFTEKPGIVVKLTADSREAAAANAIAKGLVRSPALPKVKEVLVVSENVGLYTGRQPGAYNGYFLIVREDIPDASERDQSLWRKCVWCRNFGKSKSRKKPGPPAGQKQCNARKALRKVGELCNGMTPAEERHISDFLTEIDRLVGGEASPSEHKVKALIRDLHYENIGQKRDGRLAIRDLGWSHYGTAVPFFDGLEGIGDRFKSSFRAHKWAWIVGGAAAVLGGIWLMKKLADGSERPTGPRRVAALGDSITAASMNSSSGYLIELLKNLPSGSTVKAFGYPLQGVGVIGSHLAEVLAWNPTDVIVLAGVNNLPATGSAGRIDNITNGLTDIYQKVKAAGARLVAVKVLPWGGYGTFNKYGLARWLALNDWIATSDLPDVIVDASGAVSSDGEKQDSQWTIDGLHPNAEGHRRIGAAISEQAF